MTAFAAAAEPVPPGQAGCVGMSVSLYSHIHNQQRRRKLSGLTLLVMCDTHARTHARTHTFTHTHIHAHTHRHVCTHTHTDMYARTHAHTLKHTYDFKLTWVGSLYLFSMYAFRKCSNLMFALFLPVTFYRTPS